MISIIDYKVANLGSIQRMFKAVGIYDVTIASSSEDIMKAEKLVLPGVGSFDQAISNISSLGLKDALIRKIVDDKVPTLGICLGMQIMTEGSEEGVEAGLGLIKGTCRRFSFPANYFRKVPHMGWKVISYQKESIFETTNEQDRRFYFVHSYYVDCKNREDVLATAHYDHEFVSSFQRGNILGVQFHPEKSLKSGMIFLKKFADEFYG